MPRLHLSLPLTTPPPRHRCEINPDDDAAVQKRDDRLFLLAAFSIVISVVQLEVSWHTATRIDPDAADDSGSGGEGDSAGRYTEARVVNGTQVHVHVYGGDGIGCDDGGAPAYVDLVELGEPMVSEALKLLGTLITFVLW